MASQRFKSIVTAALVLQIQALFPICAEAQNDKRTDFYRGPGGTAGKTAILPIGTKFEGRIRSTISSRSRQGERFAIEIGAPVMGNGSEVIIPTGAEIQGEVVEAVPSSRVPKDAGMRLHPLGKLRTQLLSLQMPGGTNYPLVASISGEANRSRGAIAASPTSRRSTVAYVGSQAGFDAVNPALQKQRMRNGQMQVLSKEAMLRDPILGEEAVGSGDQHKFVRSLVKKGRDLYIYSGSPITIRLDAPLKISFGASTGTASIDLNSDIEQSTRPVQKGGRRFSAEREQVEVQDSTTGGGGEQAAPVEVEKTSSNKKAKKSKKDGGSSNSQPVNTTPASSDF